MGNNLDRDLLKADNETHSQYCMVARYHSGDENGKSNAKFAKFVIPEDAKSAGFSEVWLAYDSTISDRESGMEMLYDEDHPLVITRRTHIGDENAYSVYERASVVVIKDVNIGVVDEERERSCKIIAENIEKIHSDKESKAGWVEVNGKVIIGRVHNGDENGSTDTYFATLSIVEQLTGKKYPLLLKDIKTLTECKESNSDFYVDPPQHDTQFQLWTNPAFGLDSLDHTWIKTIDPVGYFCCAGGHGEEKHLGNYAVPGYAYNVMNEVRNGPLHEDAIGILYLVQGVCHQMANRFLYPSGKSISNMQFDQTPKGYKVSTILYGVYGYGYEDWRDNYYIPAYEKYKAGYYRNVVDMQLKFNKERVRESLYAALNSFKVILTNGELELLYQTQGEWLESYEDIMRKYKFINNENEYVIPSDLTQQAVIDMTNEVIAAQNGASKQIRRAVGAATWTKLNDGVPEVFDIVSVSEALAFYAPYIKKVNKDR